MNNCNGSFQEKLIISATNYVRKIMTINENIWVFINDNKIFKSTNHSGMYDKENFIIRYNRGWIQMATYEQIIKCAFHESFHAVQHQALVGRMLEINSQWFTEEELDRLEYEFKDENYNNSNSNWHSYLIEQQAETFGRILYDKFAKEYEDLEEFIDQYYGLFPNKE